MGFESKSFNVRLKDGTDASIKAFSPETFRNIKQTNPQEGEFVLEIQRGDKDEVIDIRDIEDISE